MPYGHIRQYQELVEQAQRKRLEITRRQQRQIAELFRQSAAYLEREAGRKGKDTLTHRWLQDYAKSLRRESRQLFREIGSIASAGIRDTAQAVAEAERRFYTKACPALSERFSDVFSAIPREMVEELISGGIYRQFAGLSERIWDYRRRYDRDIQTILNRGIAQQKSAYDLAKDLERYLDPSAKKPWNWGTVYPGVSRVVDYNAQRLARTSVTHAYQLAFVRATRDNPFVTAYQWHSANGGRVCPLCRARDGQRFEKDALPLDHPNGMCTVTAVIEKSYEQLGRELGDWAAGRGSHPEIDKWLGDATISVRSSGQNYDQAFAANVAYLGSREYRQKFDGLTSSRRADRMLYQYTSAIIRENDGKATETVVFLDSRTGKGLSAVRTGDFGGDSIPIPDTKGTLILTHNHSTSDSFSIEDIESLNLVEELECIVAGGHDGTVYALKIGAGQRLDGLDLEHARMQWQRYYRSNGRSADAATSLLAAEYGWEYYKR